MNAFVNEIAQRVAVKANVVWVLGFVALALAIASAFRLARLFSGQVEARAFWNRLESLATWWGLFVLLLLIAVLGEGAAVVLFAAGSFLGLREFRALAGGRMEGVRLWWGLAYLAVPLHYLTIHLKEFGPFWTVVPVWVFLILLVRLVVTGQPRGFLETAGITFLGMMLIVFLFSHAPLLLALGDEVNPVAGAFGLFLYLVLLTAINDIAQALWGRQFGRHKITPTVSPNKTWEGLLLGAGTTVVLGVVLAGVLTPFADRPFRVGAERWDIPYLPALAAGGLIALGGFCGDITMSALKREVGVKDSGTLMPGQGGILDRIDSLTFSAPLFFYFTYIFYG